MKKNKKILDNKLTRKAVKSTVDGILGVVRKIALGEDLRYFDDVYDFVLNMSDEEFCSYQLPSEDVTNPVELICESTEDLVEVD